MNFGEVVAFLVTVTGWTYDYIEESMTLPRFHELADYWQGNPPLHLMVKSYLGIETKSKPKPEVEEAAKAEFFGLFSGGVLRV